MEEKKGLLDITTVQVVINFKDKSGYIVPLSDLQGAFLLHTLGFKINEETKKVTHYTDKEMNEVYELMPDLDSSTKKEKEEE